MKVKKLLKSCRADVLPDKKIKDDIKNELGFNDAVPASVTAGGAAVAVKRRSFIIAVSAAALAIIIALCVALPALFGGKSWDGNFLGGDKFSQITDSESFYAYGAASVGAVISSRNASGGTETVSASKSTVASALRVPDKDTEKQNVETVNRYLSLVESLLSDGDIQGTDIGGGEGYESGMKISYSDLLGNNVTYYMYYNKFLRGEQWEGDEREQYYSIEGVLEIDGVSYPVEGNYTSESEDDESEEELFFKAYTSEDSYIEVNRQSETENDGGESEYEYVYSLYTRGELIEKTIVEYESEDGELELLMRIWRDGREEELVFEDETEKGERVIAVRGNVGGERFNFRIYVREGRYHYVFGDGSSSDFDRYGREDDDD